MLRNRVFISEGNSYSLAFPSSVPTALARSAENFKAFTSIRSCTNYRLFSSPFSPSVCLLSPPSIICILGVQTVSAARRRSVVLAALVSYPQTRRKRSQRDEDKLDGAATWAALCLIFFIIINSPLLLLRSHISPSLMCH